MVTDISSDSAFTSVGPKRSCLAEALAYRNRGWSVIPIKEGTKKSGVPWMQYQNEPADERQLAQWFDRERGGCFADLGIVLGDVSGRLAVRDFDVLESYEDWAREHPKFSLELPTVSTPRGAHVYFRVPPHLNVSKTETYVDGELRFNGAYVVAPPSYHPDGDQYKWRVHLPAGNIPEIDPRAAGLIGKPKNRSRNRSKTPQWNLSLRTKRFLTGGAAQGERNNELFTAACDMAGNQWDEADAGAMLSVVAQRSGLTKAEAESTIASAFRRTRTPSRPEPADPSQLAASTTPKIQFIEYVYNSDRVNVLFDRIINALIPTNRFFNLDSQLVYVRSGLGPVRVTEQNLNGLISTVLELAILKEGRRGRPLQRYSLLPKELVGAFTTSPRVACSFARLKQYTRSPVFDLNWNFIANPGFHPASEIYYDGPTISPVDSRCITEKVLRDFCWREQVDRVNYIGMLITALTMPHWITGHPLMVFNGNKPGVGKSLLAKIHAVFVDGHLPQTLGFSPNDLEFEKQLATRVEEGDRAIIIDNAKGTRHTPMVESQVLERAVTDPILNFRRLGKNASICRENDVVFCLTMNYTLLSPDLRRRHIPVNLEQSADVRNIVFPIKQMELYVLAHRLTMIAEVAGMVLRAREFGSQRDESSARHSISQVWATTVGTLLQLNGLPGFLSNFEESEHAFDPDYELMLEICEKCHHQPQATASEWADRLAGSLLQAKFTDINGKRRGERAQATILGRLFTQYLNATLETPSGRFRLVSERIGSGHASAVYRFVCIPTEEGR